MLCNELTRETSNRLYRDVLRDEDTAAMRELCKRDLFFLLSSACRRVDMNDDWIYARCREVEANPNEHLDLWAREHYKSTIITFGKTIQDILCNPEETVGIFSHTRPIAKGFLAQIMREFENNDFLKDLFPDVLYRHPRKEAVKWGLDDGIIVKRKGNPKESTVEAWGLIDGQPTSKHFSKLIYDDIVTEKSVTTPDQLQKTLTAVELSYALGQKGGVKRFAGTRYHYNDAYRTLIERGTVIPRVYPATKDGTVHGEPVLLTRQQLEAKRRDMGPYTFASQMLLDPREDSVMGFKEEWLRFYDVLRNNYGWNFYVLVDAAKEKKKDNDYTVILVIALAPDGNYYLIDGVRDRLSLTQRAQKVFEFVFKYKPLDVGYEEYGLMCDIEHLQYEMERRNYRFKITKLAGSMPKNDRIRRLVPVYEQGRFWLPHKLFFVTYEGKLADLVKDFVTEEFTAFPVAVHDDILDTMARILDPELQAKFPELRLEPGPGQSQAPSMTMETGTDRVQTEYDVLA